MKFQRLQIVAVIAICLCLDSSPALAQAIASFGKYSIPKSEFLQAFGKNNSNTPPSQKAYRDYLGLYTHYKLKVRAAYDEHLDTLPALKAELQNFRNQIADSYMNDQAILDRLVNEAFERSQKDIHLAQIFIALPSNATDTMTAYKKSMQAFQALRQGKDFAAVADEFSEDPFVKSNHGDIHFITVFSLPYDLETLAYTTGPGKFSIPFRGKNGYHIFSNLGERKAAGRIRAAQILLAFPYGAGEGAKAESKQRADSIYKALLSGSDFESLANKFSGDNVSYQAGGQMPEFGIGKYDLVFEEAAFGLQQDGALSKPVETTYGYHLVKRLSRKPVSTEKNKPTLDGLRQQVSADARIDIARQAMNKRIQMVTGFREHQVDAGRLWAYTDSALKNPNLPPQNGIGPSTLLFTIGQQSFTVKDWLTYRYSIRNIAALTRAKTPRMLLDQYQQAAAYEYYRAHLEKYNPAFSTQLLEFKDGNLLFEIMQRRVWDKAANDTARLYTYYKTSANKYWWENSADAILFTCAGQRAAKALKKGLDGNIRSWRSASDSAAPLVQADSGRFEVSQMPVLQQAGLQPGQFSYLLTNQSDSTVVLAWLVRKYPLHQSRSFEDARGMITNDYQNALEAEWIKELERKYPVKINEAVLNSLPR